MALARSNRLLPVLGSIVLLMTVFVGFKSCSSDNRHAPGVSPRASDTLAPDADTPADTIRTLTARVTDMTAQLEALRDTINSADADVVVVATPIDLKARIRIDKPVVRARYEFADAGEPTLGGLVDAFLAKHRIAVRGKATA